MPFSFLGKLSSLFQMSQAQIPSALDPQRKPIIEWLEVKLFRVDPAVACSQFYLNRIWHWERTGLLRHEGLTFEFIRHDRATVYIKVDRLSYDNDAYSSSVKVFNSSGAGLAAESPDQDSDSSIFKAKDWVQILDRDECAFFFHPSPPGSQPHSSLISLGTTTFSGAQRSLPPPNLIEVMLVVHAVSHARVEYGIWEANCWWLARSIRMCIERRWGKGPDYPLPNIVIAGFDTGAERITRDQVKIWDNYKVIDAKRLEALNHKANMEAALQQVEEALQRADDAETVSRQNMAARAAAEEARIEAEEARAVERKARIAEREARIAEREARIAAEERLAQLEAQLQNLTLRGSNA